MNGNQLYLFELIQKLQEIQKQYGDYLPIYLCDCHFELDDIFVGINGVKRVISLDGKNFDKKCYDGDFCE